jgi:uncharacterized Zn finger protein (UPF0148 family)
MIRHQGRVCGCCGTPLVREAQDATLCAACQDWQENVAVREAETASAYASREQQKERQQQWEARRK